jgi:hypothetical protein
LGDFVRRVFSVLFIVILSMAVAKAQEPLVIKPDTCSSLIKTANSLAHHQSELLLAQARFDLHCGKAPRFHAYDLSTCNELEAKIAVMQKVLSVCAPLVQTSLGAVAAGAAAAGAAGAAVGAVLDPVPEPPRAPLSSPIG